MTAAPATGGRGGAAGAAAVALVGIVAAAQCARARGLLEADEVLHWLYARHAAAEPANLLHPWARPLYTLALAPIAGAGFGAAKWLSALAAFATAFGVWRAAVRLGRRFAAAAPLLLLAQPFFVQQCYGAWTEIVFAAGVAWWTWSLAAERPRTAAALSGLLPLVRPEGAFFALFTGVAAGAGFLRDREGRTARGAFFLAPLGVVAWFGAAWALTGDPLWVLHRWPWAPGASYGRGDASWLVEALPAVAPGGLFIAAAAGAFAPGGKRTALAALLGAAVFLVHGALWAAGAFGSAGYLRYFVTVAPILALLGAGALEFLARGRLAPQATKLALLALALGFGVAYADGGRRARWTPPDEPLDARLFAAVGRALVRAEGPDVVVYAAHPFVYLEVPRVPPGRFDNLGALGADALRAAPVGAWLVVEDRFYLPGGNPPEADLLALGFRRQAPPALALDGGLGDARHDPALAAMVWSWWRKERA